MKFHFLPVRIACAILLTGAYAQAERPLFSVVPLGVFPIGFNNSGEISTVYYRRNANGNNEPYPDLQQLDGNPPPNSGTVRAGGLADPPPGWDGVLISHTLLSETGTTALELVRYATPTSLAVVEVGVANLRTGVVDVLAGTPVNAEFGRNPQNSHGGNAIVIQAGTAITQLQPYRYTAEEGWKPLGNLRPGGDDSPLAVNDRGDVVGNAGDGFQGGGSIPFIYTDLGGTQEITDHGRTLEGEAVAINNSGLVTGTGDGRAFLFNSKTMEFEFLTEQVTGWRGVDINEAGAIIGATDFGFSGNLFGGPSGSAFYWDRENGAISLENLIGDQLDEWFITGASEINDNGYILATGYNRYSGTSNHQLLLRPIPEPGTAGLLLVALAGSSFWRRRRLL